MGVLMGQNISLFRLAGLIMLLGHVLLCRQSAQAQFSPGALSRAHQALEGVSNCTRCHESGQEISGAKCLSCHTEIRTRIEGQRGYHFTVRSQSCIQCHTDHIGRTATITRFDPQHFDHTRTGFPLDGRHVSLDCERCHTAAHINDPDIKKILIDYPHTTYLGVMSTCVPCHDDRHQETLGTQCRTCHSTQSWQPVNGFDHNATRFPLTDRHEAVACEKCHAGLLEKEQRQPLVFDTRPFNDCKGCHTSPHRQQLSARACISCHSTTGWSAKPLSRFNHDLTGFPLAGAHTAVPCRQCHGNGMQESSLHPHTTCAMCHDDTHQGAFKKMYSNDCAGCHTLDGFSPSTFSLGRHQQTRFPLTGAHVAILCMECHRQESESETMFHFSSLRCDSCHQDPHRGQFADDMADASCATCHTTRTWVVEAFDHNQTRFPLLGLHRQTPCVQCHTPGMLDGMSVAQYRQTPTDCQQCHADVHLGQFAHQDHTRCAACHVPNGWRQLLFDHDVRSVFPLTGGHAGVACGECHRAEHRGNTVFIRYKPLSTTCESCHQPER